MLRAAGGSLSEEALDRMPVPEGVKELISRRLTGLGEDAIGLLVLGAVVGRTIPVTVLEALSDDDPLEVLEAATAAGLMVEGRDDSFSFTHALVREVLYEQPSASRRVRLHKRVGEALEEPRRHERRTGAPLLRGAQRRRGREGARVRARGRRAGGALGRLRGGLQRTTGGRSS